MLNAVIVDDEVHVLNLLKMFLQKTGQVNVMQTFTDPVEVLRNMTNLKPDVVFLDIEMPEINGLELANNIMEQNDEVMVVFVTGYNKYALEAFQVNALDYILKPVNQNRIEKCISKLNKFKSPRSEKKITIEKKIFCFGDFEVYGSNGLIKWPTRKVEEMLAYFIINRDCNIGRWELGEILWPGREPEKIKTSVHTSLFRLRKTIKENNIPIKILSKTGGNGVYRCELEELYCDLIEFENSKVENATINKNNINEFEKICSLYKDDLFLKKYYGWCENEKEYLERKYINILKSIALFYIQEGVYKKATDKLMIIKKRLPFDEEIHQMILRIYGKQKNRALLIQYHEEFKIRLLKEMGIKPNKETDKLFKSLLNGL
ncbi:response regulator [Clostridium beijerinckii]|uniref:response regulator n=1 Tax=Clostridium beijerinckii TaxID=1520 RepID=UPI001361734B|nr:response regulator [Clostridium beijerinckii]MZK53527.1 response regulator [Clostridium beijerinckii]MZK60448.1 response regulator [Clostridium beijerinckii]MZK70265.1 response regulator [Clostridium beijerinckii]MZK76071.1 response regulator [Clostridium beijerinckii]MZK85176.1 response regulator [Clostridium beijerinckii]